MEGIQRGLILNIRGKKRTCTRCTHLKRQVKIQTVKKSLLVDTENFKKGVAKKVGLIDVMLDICLRSK